MMNTFSKVQTKGAILRMVETHAKCLFRQPSSFSTQQPSWLVKMGCLQPRSIK